MTWCSHWNLDLGPPSVQAEHRSARQGTHCWQGTHTPTNTHPYMLEGSPESMRTPAHRHVHGDVHACRTRRNHDTMHRRHLAAGGRARCLSLAGSAMHSVPGKHKHLNAHTGACRRYHDGTHTLLALPFSTVTKRMGSTYPSIMI